MLTSLRQPLQSAHHSVLVCQASSCGSCQRRTTAPPAGRCRSARRRRSATRSWPQPSPPSPGEHRKRSSLHFLLTNFASRRPLSRLRIEDYLLMLPDLNHDTYKAALQRLTKTVFVDTPDLVLNQNFPLPAAGWRRRSSTAPPWSCSTAATRRTWPASTGRNTGCAVSMRCGGCDAAAAPFVKASSSHRSPTGACASLPFPQRSYVTLSSRVPWIM